MNDRLELDPEAMRRLGYRVVDQIVAAREGMSGETVSTVISRREAEGLLREPIPEHGADPEALVDWLGAEVFSKVTNVDHARFFAFVPGAGNFVSAMGDALAAGHNVFAGTWLGGSAAAELELVVMDWLRIACGLPEAGGGLFVSGGSMANLTALAAARHAVLGSHSAQGVVYYPDQTHSAVERALRVIGLEEGNMRKIETGSRQRIDPAALAEAIARDRDAGRKPFCVVANAGTTNTGAVDPLDELADLCTAENIWLHVDGAYGAASVLGKRGKDALSGIGRADSIALDPHKWLFQAFECGCLLVRDMSILRNAYAIHPEYMRDTLREDEEINFCEYGIQLSRSFRAVKLWLTLKTFGSAAIGAAIDRAFDHADTAHRWLVDAPGWEVVTEPEMAILTFAYGGEKSGAVNTRLSNALRDSGQAMVSTTILNGRTVLRLCPINPRTTSADVVGTLEALDRLAKDAAG